MEYRLINRHPPLDKQEPDIFTSRTAFGRL